MRKLLLLSAVIAFSGFQTLADVNMFPQNIILEKSGNKLHLEMKLNLAEQTVRSNQALLITPVITSADSSVNLKSVAVYGRERYIQYRRENNGMLTNGFEFSLKAKDVSDSYVYTYSVPWQDWMDGADASLRLDMYGCCHTILAESLVYVGAVHDKDKPVEISQIPIPEERKQKTETITFTVLFPLNKYCIDSSLSDNAEVLQNLKSFILDTVSNPDTEIKSIVVSGFSSPEGQSEQNYRLAEKRANTLIEYISEFYSNTDDVTSIHFSTENWSSISGSCSYVDKNSKYYNELLKKCPPLRRTEVVITYNTCLNN